MGKENFSQMYKDACQSLGVNKLTIKLSHFCSTYNPRKNYAGLVVYHHNGQYKWRNNSGIAKGYNCRGIYVLIMCTDDWPPDSYRRSGQGMVHDYMYKQMFGCSYEDKVTCCGGFAIMKGQKKYSSIWLNRQSSNQTGRSWSSDGDKNLSAEEQVIVDLAIEEWKNRGANGIIAIPDALDAIFRIGALSL